MILISDAATAKAIIAKIGAALDYLNERTKTQTCAVAVTHPSTGAVRVALDDDAVLALGVADRLLLIDKNSTADLKFIAAKRQVGGGGRP